MADIDTLVSDIYAVLKNKKKGPPTDIFSENLQNIFNHRVHLTEEELDTKNSVLRLSTVGAPLCKLTYKHRRLDLAEEFQGSTLLKFFYGDLLETLILQLAVVAGHDVTDLQKEVEFDGVVGHIDAIIDGVLIDVKSASSYAFDKFVSGKIFEEGQDSFGYISQLSAYKKALNIDKAGWLVIDKTNGKMHLVMLPEDKIDNMLSTRIADIKFMLDNPEVIVPRSYEEKPEGLSGNLVLGTQCSYCPFKFDCWRDKNDGMGLRTFIYSSGPKYFTKIVKEPRVQEINIEYRGTND